VLVTSLVLTLRTHRHRFAESADAGPAAGFAERNRAHVPVVRGAGSTVGESQRLWTRRGITP